MITVTKLPDFGDYLENFTSRIGAPFIPSEQKKQELYHIATGKQCNRYMLGGARVVKTASFQFENNKLYLVKQDTDGQSTFLTIEPLSLVKFETQHHFINHEQLANNVKVLLCQTISQYAIDRIDFSNNQELFTINLYEDTTGLFANIQNTTPIPRVYAQKIVKLLAPNFAYGDWNYKKSIRAINKDMTRTRDGKYLQFKMTVQLSSFF